MEAMPDMPRQRFVPDSDTVAAAHNRMLEAESERHAFIRQHWENTLAAVHVALGLLREIYPSDADLLSTETRDHLGVAEVQLTYAHLHLNDCQREMLGEELDDVLSGRLECD